MGKVDRGSCRRCCAPVLFAKGKRKWFALDVDKVRRGTRYRVLRRDNVPFAMTESTLDGHRIHSCPRPARAEQGRLF